VSFATITLCVDSQRVIPKVSVYFVIDSVRKLLDTPSYTSTSPYVFIMWCLIKYRDNFPFTIQGSLLERGLSAGVSNY